MLSVQVSLIVRLVLENFLCPLDFGGNLAVCADLVNLAHVHTLVNQVDSLDLILVNLTIVSNGFPWRRVVPVVSGNLLVRCIRYRANRLFLLIISIVVLMLLLVVFAHHAHLVCIATRIGLLYFKTLLPLLPKLGTAGLLLLLRLWVD